MNDYNLYNSQSTSFDISPTMKEILIEFEHVQHSGHIVLFDMLVADIERQRSQFHCCLLGKVWCIPKQGGAQTVQVVRWVVVPSGFAAGENSRAQGWSIG